MSETAVRLIQELGALSYQEREDIAYQLIRDLDDEARSRGDAAWEVDFHRRLDAIHYGKANLSPAT